MEHRNELVSHQKKGINKCAACDNNLANDSYVLLCNCCEMWLCVECLYILKSQYKLFAKMSQCLGLAWYCPVCKQKYQETTPEVIKKIVTESLPKFKPDLQNELYLKFQALLKPVGEQISKLEAKIMDKCSKAK